MSQITTEKFEHFIRDVNPSSLVSKLARQQYVLRCGLVYLIDYAMSEFALTNPQKLRAARDLSNPEVEAQPQRWAEQFEAKADEAERGSVPLGLIYRLAGDLCARVSPQPQGDTATASHEEFAA